MPSPAPTLRVGLSLASNTGRLEGTPQSGGSFALAVTVTDSASPAQRRSRTFSVEFSEPPCEFKISPAQIKAGSAGETATVQFGASPAELLLDLV